METVYFIIGIISISILFTIGWLVNVVLTQMQQLKNLKQAIHGVVSNDITESQVYDIVNSQINKTSDTLSNEIKGEKDNLSQIISKLDHNIKQEQGEIYRYIDNVKNDFKQEIEINRVTNRRNVTNGDLQTEY